MWNGAVAVRRAACALANWMCEPGLVGRSYCATPCGLHNGSAMKQEERGLGAGGAEACGLSRCSTLRGTGRMRWHDTASTLRRDLDTAIVRLLCVQLRIRIYVRDTSTQIQEPYYYYMLVVSVSGVSIS